MNYCSITQLVSDYCFMLFYGIAFIISLYKYRFYYNTILKYLPILIAYTLLTETMGLLIKDVEEIQIIYIEEYAHFNSFIYNIYELIFFGYFYFIYWKVLNIKKNKNMVKYGALAYLIATIVNAYFVNFIIWPQLYASLIGSVLLITSILLYFKEYHQSNKWTSGLLVWISIGLLIFNVFFPPIMFTGMWNYEVYQTWNLRQVHYALIILMYICFSISFMGLKRRISSEEI